MTNRFDLIVIGGGAAGLVTAAGGAGLGARVALIERDRLGGECLWTGCVPSKALLASARAVAAARDGARFGVRATGIEVDFGAVLAHVRQAQRAIEPNDSPERFRGLGVDVIHGTARFIGDRTVRVADRTLSARHIVVATGSRPAIPRIPGIDSVPFHTNETIFAIEALPPSLAIIGCGAIGVELAQAFALLGSRVTMIEAAPRILATEDAELAGLLHAELEQAGVVIHTSARAHGVERHGGGIRLRLEGATIDAAALLVAAGRRAELDSLEPAAGGVEIRDHLPVLDDRLRTTARNVWAAGDVTGAPRFTHVADYQARTVLRNALFPFARKVNYDVVPRVIYALPELARVGLTEAEARERHGDAVRTWTRAFAGLDRAIADGRTTGMLKLVADRKGRLLGAHVLGEHASSMIAQLTLALREGVPLARLAATMHAYPTYPEAVRHAADAYMRSRLTGLPRALIQRIVRRP